jgi:hypothetical protein
MVNNDGDAHSLPARLLQTIIDVELDAEVAPLAAADG